MSYSARLSASHFCSGGSGHEHHAGDGYRADARDRHPPRLGAARDIIEQFLIEATVITPSGGSVGVLLGMAVPPIFLDSRGFQW